MDRNNNGVIDSIDDTVALTEELENDTIDENEDARWADDGGAVN